MNRQLKRDVVSCTLVMAVLGCVACFSESSERKPPQTLTAALSASPAPQWVLDSEAQVPAAVKSLASPLLSPSEHLISAIEGQLTSTKETQYRVAIFDAATNRTRKLVLMASGRFLTAEALAKAEEAKYRLAHGALDSALHAAISKSPSSKYSVRVIFKASHNPQLAGPPKSVGASQLASFKTQLKAALDAAASKIEAEIQNRGGAVLTRPSYAPLIIASIPGTALLAHFKDRADIDWIAQTRPNTITHYAAQSTQDLNLPQTFHDQGFFGAGFPARVGITGEEGGPGQHCRIYFEHPAFAFTNTILQTAATPCSVDNDCVGQCGTYAVCYNGSCTAHHGTLVAGMVGHRVAGLSRGAPEVWLYMTNAADIHVNDLDWLYQRDVFTVNESWSGLKKDIFAQDHYANLGMVFSQAAGQPPDGQTGVNTETECAAGNILCVGGYRTVSSFYDPTFTKNFSTCSRWYSGCDREDPHVTFHGENVTSTTNHREYEYWYGAAGTSFAAPAAAGMVALMMERWPFLFGGSPHPVRAALMASADRDVHQIASTPSCPTDGKTFSDYRCPDERDGAGVPNALRVEQMVSNGRVTNYWQLREGDLSSWLTLGQATVPQGGTLRAALSWSTCPSENTNGTHVDLDLLILDDRGIPIAGGRSWDGNYEITEITSTSTMNYTIVAELFGWQDCPGFDILDPYGQVVDRFVHAGFAFDVR